MMSANCAGALFLTVILAAGLIWAALAERPARMDPGQQKVDVTGWPLHPEEPDEELITSHSFRPGDAPRSYDEIVDGLEQDGAAIMNQEEWILFNIENDRRNRLPDNLVPIKHEGSYRWAWGGYGYYWDDMLREGYTYGNETGRFTFTEGVMIPEDWSQQ